MSLEQFNKAVLHFQQEARLLVVENEKLKTQLEPESGEEQKLQAVLGEVKTMFKTGDTVIVKNTSYIGVIKGFNQRLGGFYPGVRFPIMVEITRSENPRFSHISGSVFEYEMDRVIKFKQQFYKINAGYRALKGGAVAPVSKLFDIAKLADQSVLTGRCYGDDYLIVPLDHSKRKAMEELLTEEKLIWEIVDTLPSHISQPEIEHG